MPSSGYQLTIIIFKFGPSLRHGYYMEGEEGRGVAPGKTETSLLVVQFTCSCNLWSWHGLLYWSWHGLWYPNTKHVFSLMCFRLNWLLASARTHTHALHLPSLAQCLWHPVLAISHHHALRVLLLLKKQQHRVLLTSVLLAYSFRSRCGQTRCRRHWTQRKRVMLLSGIKHSELQLNATHRLKWSPPVYKYSLIQFVLPCKLLTSETCKLLDDIGSGITCGPRFASLSYC